MPTVHRLDHPLFLVLERKDAMWLPFRSAIILPADGGWTWLIENSCSIDNKSQQNPPAKWCHYQTSGGSSICPRCAHTDHVRTVQTSQDASAHPEEKPRELAAGQGPTTSPEEEEVTHWTSLDFPSLLITLLFRLFVALLPGKTCAFPRFWID